MVVLVVVAVVAELVGGATNPMVVVDGIGNVEILGTLVIIGNDVVVIGWARRFESALFADEVVDVVVTGRKLVEVGANVAVVVDGVGNEKGTLVVAVVEGVENGNVGIVVLVATVAAVAVVAGVDNENEGIA